MFKLNLNLFVAFLFFLIRLNKIICDEYKIIETNDGSIRGVRKITFWKHVDYYSFKGIPYAEKPIGPLRFKVNS